MGTKQFKQKTIQTKNKRYIRNKNVLFLSVHKLNPFLILNSSLGFLLPLDRSL